MDDLQAIHNSTPSVTKTNAEKTKSIEIIHPTKMLMTENFIEIKYKDMRPKPTLREKQGKVARTSKISKMFEKCQKIEKIRFFSAYTAACLSARLG